MKFNDIRISTKLKFGFTTIIILAGLFSFYCWTQVKNLHKLSKTIDFLMEVEISLKEVENNVLKSSKLSEIDAIKINSLFVTGDNYIKELSQIVDDKKIIKDIETDFKECRQKYNIFYTNLSKYSSNFELHQIKEKQLIEYLNEKNNLSTETTQLRESLSEKEKYFNYLDPKFDNYLKINFNEFVISKTLKPNIKTHIQSYFTSFNTVKNSWIELSQSKNNFNKIINHLPSKIKDFEHIAHEKTNNTFIETSSLIVTFIVISLIFSLLLFEIIKRNISSGIEKVKEIVYKVSSGDLSIDIPEADLRRKDEMGVLLNLIFNMSKKLEEIVTSVVIGSEQILSASRELSNTSQLVSHGSSTQASSAEEISSSIEEMSSNILQNTDNANNTEQIASKVSLEIESISQKICSTVEAMKEIFNKVSVIGDIAFQTNILALNAAVEAARAGEHGKGFAVVASEVRKLAEHSQEAANEINNLSSQSLHSAEISSELLTKLVAEVQKTALLVKEIAASSIEQTTGTEQIISAIQQLNRIIQQNAAASEELATSSEQLEAHSNQLKETVSYFKISSKIETQETNKRKKIDLNDNNKKLEKKPFAIPKNNENSKGVIIDMGKPDKLDDEYERF